MPNNPMNTDFVDKAARFAITAHAGTERRGKGFPYVIHVMEAAAIVASITNDPELIATAFLHDVIEDTEVTAETLRSEFGNRVTDLVLGESDIEMPELSEAASWQARKQYAIDRLARQSRDAKIVALGDKLSNMRAIARDFDEIGDELWKRFHAPDPRLHQWHYEKLAEVMKDLDDTAAYREFVYLIHKTFSRAFQRQEDKS